MKDPNAKWDYLIIGAMLVGFGTYAALSEQDKPTQPETQAAQQSEPSCDAIRDENAALRTVIDLKERQRVNLEAALKAERAK